MKQIKVCLATLLVAFMGYQTAAGQEHKNYNERYQRLSKEEIEEKRQAYFTRELDLTPEQSKQLAQVMNEFHRERFKLWQALEESNKGYLRTETPSESDAEAYWLAILDNKVKMAELGRTYALKCKGIIPASKLLKLEALKTKFAREFMSQREGKKRGDGRGEYKKKYLK